MSWALATATNRRTTFDDTDIRFSYAGLWRLEYSSRIGPENTLLMRSTNGWCSFW
ncbi:hypothetical protein QWI30_02160 [Citrobacter freundii]|nr:hypothetical protein [Citrobacter freundii]